MNDAEKLISRLTLPLEPDADEDDAFESGEFFYFCSWNVLFVINSWFRVVKRRYNKSVIAV